MFKVKDGHITKFYRTQINESRYAYTSEAKQLIIQEYQDRVLGMTLQGARAFPDYWLAKAESYYNKRIMETVKEQEEGSEINKRLRKQPKAQRDKTYYFAP